MLRARTLWALWALPLLLRAAVAQGPAPAMGWLSLLGSVRPGKAVVRSVRAVAPDLFVEMADRVRAWGYPLEAHTVRTEDGYLLTLHRVPHGRLGASRDDPPGAAARPPVLLQHGLFGCSEYWVIGGPRLSPALMLADAGYDVWIANSRGNHFSLLHESMGRHDPRFWKFSWHEIGMYDVPANIDYVLNATQQEKLFLMSHSMGNTALYVALSMRPEYNVKIRLQVALSPAVYFDGLGSAPVQVLLPNTEFIKTVLNSMPTYELLPKSNSAIALIYLACNEKAYFNKLCAVALSWLVGAVDLNNTTNLCLQLTRSGSSSSGLVPLHFTQIIRSNEFLQFDHGKEENERQYGTPQPPKYPLHKVTIPIALYVSDGDILVPTKGVKRLAKTLPNVVSFHVITETFFNHLDFVYHPKMKEVLMKHVLGVMERF